MKNIKLKFYGLGYNNNYQADILVYDINNNIVYEGKTYNSEIIICLEKNRVYKLVANSLGDIICTIFYIGNNCEYNFAFNRAINTNIRKDSSITFLLTDYYYNNLPIERGEIILWQK